MPVKWRFTGICANIFYRLLLCFSKLVVIPAPHTTCNAGKINVLASVDTHYSTLVERIKLASLLIHATSLMLVAKLRFALRI